MDVPQKQIKKVVLTNLFGWDVVCYRLGDSIFIAGESEIAAINLNTKKLRYCSEEHLKAQDFAKEKFGEELYHAFFFRAIFEWNGGTVYSAKISEAVDVPPIGMIYIACKDENIISYISVDLIQDKMEDGIEIKMVEQCDFPDGTISYCFYLNAQEFTEEAFLEDLETTQLQEYAIY